jgi:hypothetical protein
LRRSRFRVTTLRLAQVEQSDSGIVARYFSAPPRLCERSGMLHKPQEMM